MNDQTITSEQRATLYRGTKRVLAYPTNQTVAGFYIASTPFVVIEEDSAHAVGAAVRTALAEFKKNVPTPARDAFKTLSQRRLEAAGVHSETDFTRGARIVTVTKNDSFLLIPHLNGGTTSSKKGFQGILSKRISLPATSDDIALGSACIQALTLCE